MDIPPNIHAFVTTKVNEVHAKIDKLQAICVEMEAFVHAEARRNAQRHQEVIARLNGNDARLNGMEARQNSDGARLVAVEAHRQEEMRG